MNAMGRPPAYTKPKADRIVAAIRRGVPLKLAAAAGGVSYNTFVRWRNDGSSPEAPPHFREFLNQVRKAEADAALRLIGQIAKAANTHWQAASWLLERRHPDMFGKDAIPPPRSLGEFEPPIRDDD